MRVTSTIENAKSEYYSKLIKLLNPKTSSKASWSILNSFVNDKKIPIISPLYHNSNFITNFCQKAELFNSFFAEQCSILLNSSKLPTNLAPQTDQSLTSIHFSQDDILKIIQNLNPHKAHGPDKVSIRMIKICGKSLCKPLEMIFKSCIKKEEYWSEWKKANIVPVHKKGDKQLLKNYRPISLLPIFGKIFERIIYNTIFEYLTTNMLISDNQSGFKPGDSCINQLLSITHEIYHSLDNGLEVRGVFLDISKTFDKVCHEGLILKLNQYRISENLLCLIKCFLKNRKQRVFLNGQTSSWIKVLAGVPQGSILSPLFFLICINDLSDDLSSNPKLLADDTSLFSVVHNKNISANELNNDLRKISNWAYQWKMSFNPDPLKQAQEVIFSCKMTKTNHPTLVFNENPVHQVALHKHLGMSLDCKLNFEEHLKTIINKIIKTIGLLCKFQDFLPRKSLLTLYKSLSDHNLIMVTLFTTKLIILLSIKDWNHFNTMRH